MGKPANRVPIWAGPASFAPVLEYTAYWTFTVSTMWLGPTALFGSGGETRIGLAEFATPWKLIRGGEICSSGSWPGCFAAAAREFCSAPSPVQPVSAAIGPRSSRASLSSPGGGSTTFCRSRSGGETSNAAVVDTRGCSAGVACAVPDETTARKPTTSIVVVPRAAVRAMRLCMMGSPASRENGDPHSSAALNQQQCAERRYRYYDAQPAAA